MPPKLYRQTDFIGETVTQMYLNEGCENSAGAWDVSGEFMGAGGLAVTYHVYRNPSKSRNFIFDVTWGPVGSYGSVQVGINGYGSYNLVVGTAPAGSSALSVDVGTYSTVTGYVQARRTSASGDSTRVEFKLANWNGTADPRVVAKGTGSRVWDKSTGILIDTTVFEGGASYITNAVPVHGEHSAVSDICA